MLCSPALVNFEQSGGLLQGAYHGVEYFKEREAPNQHLDSGDHSQQENQKEEDVE